jgi:Family of unknown function (DUF6530)
MGENSAPDVEGLKHKPMFLLPYRNYDGPYAGDSDCRFLSLGWAQYDPRSASLKALRHTGDRWSRQSEELPLHRVIDAVILLASAIDAMAGSHLNTIEFPAGTFENQSNGLLIHAGIEAPNAFAREINSDLVLRRLERLRGILNAMSDRSSRSS